MKCNECQEALSAYYDKRLDKEQAAAVAAHLKACPDCKKEYEQLTMMLDCLKEPQEETIVPPLLHQQMLEKVAKSAQKDKVKHLFIPRIGGMVAALLVGVILIKMNPLEIGERPMLDESYGLSTAQVPEQFTEQAADTTSDKQEGKIRVITDEQQIESAAATNEVIENTEPASRMSKGEEAVPDKAMLDENDHSSIAAQPAEIQEKAASSMVSDHQLWEIETDNINDVIQYLEDYARDMDAKMEIRYEEKESFILYGITDAKALFEVLQTQSFTKSLISIDESGENIKIVIKA